MKSRAVASLTQILDRVDQVHDGVHDGRIVRTGFPSLDRAIGGGMLGGDLVVLGGDTGVGTSSLALGMAIRQPSPSLLLTGEMRVERVYERALASVSGVTIQRTRLGLIDDDERLRLAAGAVSLREKAPRVELLRHDGMLSVTRAIEADKALVESDAPRLIIVDGLESLVETDDDRDNALAFAVIALKRIAIEHNIVLLLLAHLPNLDVARQDKRPRLADFGVRGAVGVHADIVLGLFREDVYDAEPGVTGATELIVLKHREGTLGYVDLYCDTSCMRFEDVLDGG